MSKPIVLLALLIILIFGNNTALPQSADRSPKTGFRQIDGLYNLYAAFAIRQNDLSVCKRSPSSSECWKRAKNIYDIVNFSKGDCDKFSPGMQQDLCRGINAGCQNIENKTAQDMCEAIDEKDARAMSKISYQPDWTFQLKVMEESEARALLGIYYGFKSGNSSDCKKFAAGDTKLIVSGICDILLSSRFDSSNFADLLSNLRKTYK